jgi:hypothetical protein
LNDIWGCEAVVMLCVTNTVCQSLKSC